MAEQKLLNTKTSVTITANYSGIYTYFVAQIAGLKAFIPVVADFVNGLFFKENELGFENGYDDISLIINTKGELIITSNSDKFFYIDDNGDLIMEEPD